MRREKLLPKKLERIFGFLKHENNEVPFFFSTDTFQLILYPSASNKCGGFNIEAFKRINDDSYRGKWADNPEVEGITSEGYRIVFCISDIPTFKNSLIEYKVNWIFYCSGNHDLDAIEGIQIAGEDVDRFFDPSRVLKRETSFNEKYGRFESFAISAGEPSVEDCGDYLMHIDGNSRQSDDEAVSEDAEHFIKVHIELNAYATLKLHSNTPLSSTSRLNLSFDKPVNLDEMFYACGQVWNFLQFVTYRSRVRADDIVAYWKDKEGRYLYNGVFLWRSLYSQIIPEEKEIQPYEYVIPYDILKGKVSDIFNVIDSGVMSFEHFCPTVSARSHYGTGRIIEILTDFEREYRNIYGTNSLRDDAFVKFRDDLIDEFKQKCESFHGKSKKWLQSFIRLLSNYDDSYVGRVFNALQNCKEIISPFLQKEYGNVSDDILQDIAKRSGQLRNDYAHNNLDIRLEPVHLSDLKTLERLIYIIRLKQIGMEKVEIQKAINELFHENMAI